MRDAAVPMALVHDEYGHFEGIATPADIFETITCVFRADTEEHDPPAFRREDGSWLLAGYIPADEMAEHLGIALPELRDYQTLAGFMLAQLQRMHSLKTGALVRAAVRMGALAADADQDTLARLDTFAAAFGLAFQVRDDLLDIEASSEQLGKTAGKDVAQAKSTYPALLGMDGARARLGELATSMRDALAPFGARAAALAALGELAVRRSH